MLAGDDVVYNGFLIVIFLFTLVHEPWWFGVVFMMAVLVWL